MSHTCCCNVAPDVINYRVPWGGALLALEPTQEELHPDVDQVILAGLAAKIGLAQDPINNLVPHATTGTKCSELARLLASIGISCVSSYILPGITWDTMQSACNKAICRRMQHLVAALTAQHSTHSTAVFHYTRCKSCKTKSPTCAKDTVTC